MVKINFIIFFGVIFFHTLNAQLPRLNDRISFSGVVVDAKEGYGLAGVSCRYGNGYLVSSDATGRFRLMANKGDTVVFTYVGYKPCPVVIPDTLSEEEYIVGVFMSPDTLALSEVLIVARSPLKRREYLLRAMNNMQDILQQAYAPVTEMDAEMNQRMMLDDFAQSVQMRGHVNVKAGIGLHSWRAFRKIQMNRRILEEQNQRRLNPEEVDLLKKLYNFKKTENVDN